MASLRRTEKQKKKKKKRKEKKERKEKNISEKRKLNVRYRNE